MNTTNLPPLPTTSLNACAQYLANINNTKLQVKNLNESIHYDSNNNNNIPKNILPSFSNNVQNTMTNSNTKNRIIHTNSHTIYSMQSDAPSQIPSNRNDKFGTNKISIPPIAPPKPPPPSKTYQYDSSDESS
eukprot:155456_1